MKIKISLPILAANFAMTLWTSIIFDAHWNVKMFAYLTKLIGRPIWVGSSTILAIAHVVIFACIAAKCIRAYTIYVASVMAFVWISFFMAMSVQDNALSIRSGLLMSLFICNAWYIVSTTKQAFEMDSHEGE